MNREIKFRIWDGHTKSFFDAEGTHYWPKIQIDDGVMKFVCADEQYQILQFTGVKDKNGKDVYESDILHEYRPKSAPMANNGINRVVVVEDIYTPFNNNCCEIIGNIYENPELLNQK